jgi:RimJ/RimL family protein N-acetyltransferase
MSPTRTVQATELETKNLRLLLQTREETRAYLERMPAHERVQVSPAWLALLEESAAADPWVDGFVLIRRADGTVVGRCGFKGPPLADGVVEIAYGIAPEHQGKGYASEAAAALAGYAFATGQVQIVRAHTLPETNASTRVLAKCGFRCVGEVIDPEDGPVWRWEKTCGA